MKGHKVLFFTWIIIGIWMLCLIASIFWYIHIKKENILEILFQIINVSFSGLAILVACVSLVHQSKDFNKQIDISTFNETIREIVESDKFSKCRMYILSNLYKNDIKVAKQILGKNKICLDDIKNICSQNNNRLTMSIAVRDLCSSYENISYICSKMDYLGTLYESRLALLLSITED